MGSYNFRIESDVLLDMEHNTSYVTLYRYGYRGGGVGTMGMDSGCTVSHAFHVRKCIIFGVSSKSGSIKTENLADKGSEYTTLHEIRFQGACIS